MTASSSATAPWKAPVMAGKINRQLAEYPGSRAESTRVSVVSDRTLREYGYLEPITPSGAPLSAAAVQQRNKDKAEEYERKCGQVWKNYRECVQKAVTNKSLDRLLDEAREDNPLKDPPPPSREERENKS